MTLQPFRALRHKQFDQIWYESNKYILTNESSRPLLECSRLISKCISSCCDKSDRLPYREIPNSVHEIDIHHTCYSGQFTDKLS